MRLLPLTALLLTCALGTSGCATSGRAAKPAVCPEPAEVPPSLMQPPRYESGLRERLFHSADKPTRKCADCNR